MLGILKKKRHRFVAEHIEGLFNFREQEILNVILDEDENRITFKSLSDGKKPPVNLSLDKITSVGVLTEKEIIEKDKSVIGRAVAGGLLLGPLGGIVGGISGVGSKKKKKNILVGVILYDDKRIVLMDYKLSVAMSPFFNKINKRLQLSGKEINL